jgi:hypothetical protein
LIKEPEKMDSEFRTGDWECKIYCEKHIGTGKKFVRVQKSVKIA